MNFHSILKSVAEQTGGSYEIGDSTVYVKSPIHSGDECFSIHGNRIFRTPLFPECNVPYTITLINTRTGEEREQRLITEYC